MSGIVECCMRGPFDYCHGINCHGFVGLQLLSSMVEKLRNYDDDPLPQDLQEGVDDDEWVCN